MVNMLKVLGILVAFTWLWVGGLALAQNVDANPPQPQGNVADLKITDEDYSMGEASSSVVMVEYASLTCGHCAEFHTLVLPKLKKEFIDTGKVRYIYRDFPLDRLALAAAMVARCAGRNNFFGFIETFYTVQSQWSEASNPLSALNRIARLGGMDQTSFDQCLGKADVQNGILARRLEAVKEFKIRSTPTVFINGDKYSGGMSLAHFQAVLRTRLSK